MHISSLLEFTRRVDKAYRFYCDPLCQRAKLSRTSFDILMFLTNHPQFYTAKDVSTYSSIRPNVISTHVNRLVEDGYLIRTDLPDDRRKVKLQCTRKADPVIREGREKQKEFYEHLTSGLSKEELDAFRHCFQVILENADALVDNPS